MKPLTAFNAAANRVIGWGVILTFGAMTVIIFLQVLFRYVLEFSLSWSEELARYLFVWLTFLGAGVAMRDGSHIEVSLVADLVKPKRPRELLRLLANLLGIVFLYVLMTRGLDVATRVFALGQVSPTMEFLPIGFNYLAIPIGCFFMILILLEQAYATCLAIIHGR